MQQIKSLFFEEKQISIYGNNENPLFCANEIGELFGLKNIRTYICDFNETQKIILQKETNGGIQNATYLTESGLYKFLFSYRKKFSFKFIECVCNVIKELHLKNILNQVQEQSSHLKIENMNNTQLQSKNLIESNLKTKVVYVCETDKKVGEYNVIKIGKTDDVQERLTNMISSYGVNMNYVYIFRCENNYNFEQFLFKIPFIKQNKYNEPFDNGRKSNETYLLSSEMTYEKIRKIILQNIGPFEKITDEEKYEAKKIDLEIKKEELKIAEQKIRSQELELEILRKKDIQHSQTSIITPEFIQKIEEMYDTFKKIYKNQDDIIKSSDKDKKSSSPYIQKYDENLNLIGHYDSFIQLTRLMPGTSTHSLKCAIENKSIYHGFRWLLLDKEKDPSVPQLLDPTKENYNRKYELLAHINISRTKINKVYTEYSEIASEFGCSSSAAASARRRQTKHNGGYIVFYNDCSDEMRKEYEENNILPTKVLSKTGTSITQIDAITNQEIMKYSCISDVTKKYKIGRNKLKEASQNNTIYKGFKWIIH